MAQYHAMFTLLLHDSSETPALRGVWLVYPFHQEIRQDYSLRIGRGLPAKDRCCRLSACYFAEWRGFDSTRLLLLYEQAAGRKLRPARQRELLQRSEAYVEAALRDFQYYQGRVTADEAKAQQLIADIRQALATL
ncbi:MAG: hypothetical protein ACXV8O_14415 [Methylobacter sp.]